MENRLDIIIFGVTGFTGKRAIPQLTKIIKSENLSLKWGIAGRTENKLREALLEMSQKTGEDYSNIPLICADVNNAESLENMTIRAKLILNAVGPYRFFGEKVIQACIKTGTHHIDVSGEPQYIEAMQLKYHQAALEKGIYLISSCGFDSIPADLGVVFVQKNFEGTVNSVESYVYSTEVGGPYPGASLNYGTFESAVYGYTHSNELRDVRSKLYPEPLPKFWPTLPSKGPIFKSDILRKWCSVFPGADRDVMLRTQRFMYQTYNQRPIQVRTYCRFNSFCSLMKIMIMGVIFAFMCTFSCTRSLLLKHPKFFTFGIFSREGPSEEKQENTYFHTVFYAEGWNEKLTDPTSKFNTKPNKTVIAKVSGKNPAYGSTCIAFVLAAITVLTENEKLPNKGGCYPPGAAFTNTSIIEKLNKYDVKFELNPVLDDAPKDDAIMHV